MLGKDTPGLGLAWWIDGIEGKPTPLENTVPEHREEPDIVDIGVVTRAQAEKERREIEGLEEKDKQSGANPRVLDEGENDSESEESESEEEETPEAEKEPEAQSEVDQPEPDPQGEVEIGKPEEELPGNPYSEAEMIVNPISREQLREEQESDKSLKALREMGKDERNRYYYNKFGILCRQALNEFGEQIEQLVLPTSQRRKAFRAAHSTLISGHLNHKSTGKKLTPHFHWPGVYDDIRKWCAACEICQKHNPGKGGKAPLHPLPVVTTPWSWIALDLVGPLSRTKRGNKYLLTCIDLSTRYPEAIPVKTTDAKSLVDPLFQILGQHGIPEWVLTDQGPQFVSTLFRELCKKVGIKHVTTTPYRPQSNGCLERFHKTLKACLAKCPNKESDWDLLIPYVLFALREAPNRSTGHSPFSLLYGRPVRGPASILASTWREDTTLPTSIDEILASLKDRLEIVSTVAESNDTKAKRTQKTEFDKTAVAEPLSIGDQVLLKIPRESKYKQSEWHGPYTVMDKPSEVTYELNTKARKKASRIFHRNSLKQHIVAVNFVTVKIAEGSEGEGGIPFPNHNSDQAGKPPSKLFSLGHMKDQERERVQDLLEGNLEAFGTHLKEPAEVEELRIHTDTPYPISQKAYQVPEKKIKAVKDEVANLLKQGIIRPSKSPWNSPAVIVPKPNGKIRLCVNYQALNRATTTDPFPIPNMEAIISKASRCSYISTLDLTKGFHQVPVAQEDIAKTSFALPWGKWEYIKMPFGVKNGPAHFQRIMTGLLGNTENANVYIDDIVIYSTSFEQHLQDLQAVFDILKRYKLRANPEKAVLCKETVNFLGHQIGSGKISPLEARITALRNYKRPETKKGVRSFLGATGFYRKFIKDYSTIASSLYLMTTKTAADRPRWNEEQDRAF